MLDRAGILIEQGAPIACERVEGVNDNMSKSHYHRYFEIYFLENGTREHIMNNEIYQTNAGDFMLFAPYIMHHSYSKEGVAFRRIVLYFCGDSINAVVLKEMLKNGSGFYQPTSKVANTVHTYLADLLREQNESGVLHDITMNTLLNALLITIMKSVTVSKKPEMKTRIAKIIDYIEQNYMKEIHLQDLSSLFYISDYYLCHEFKKYTNRTIVQYINATRILNAQRQIMETSHSFTTIAADTGFSSLTHFNRTFKAVVGMSPSAFRKTLHN